MTQRDVNKLVDHLFRRESGKMVAVLTRVFGPEHLEVVEDVVQDALLQASQVWPERGVPDNPAAWLYRAAKNKAVDIFRHDNHSVRLDPADESAARADFLSSPADEAWSEELIKDDMLRMMFVCCHPGIPDASQVTLILKALCGFSTAEIARAFVTREDTISKRLYRAKEFFRENKIGFAVPSPDVLSGRIDAVLNSIYLLFNEGYSSTESDQFVREDLMEEAMVLCRTMTEIFYTQVPDTFALMALMCFHASRNESRLTPDGEIILLENQDRSKWNRNLIALGNEYMSRSAFGDSLSKYHLEAAIAYEHCIASSFESTNWKRILDLYESLCILSPSPIYELNKAVAVLRVEGADEALHAIMNISERKLIEPYYLYHSLLGEIYQQLEKNSEAKDEFRRAMKLTKSDAEKKLLQSKLQS